ncbi:MAG TPA: hypothetical protein VE593_05950 [Nitrososphaeraceae archaeon]|nr:hypothetical protein [Nitrososphaeraceae archaeon]
MKLVGNKKWLVKRYAYITKLLVTIMLMDRNAVKYVSYSWNGKDCDVLVAIVN